MSKVIKYILCFLLGASIAFLGIFIYRNRVKVNRLYYYPNYMTVTTNDLIEDNNIYVELSASYKNFNVNNTTSTSTNNNNGNYSNIYSSYQEFTNSVSDKDKNGLYNRTGNRCFYSYT